MFAASKSAKAAAAGGGGTVTDPQINYVTTLLAGDGTNGQQNSTFVDSSANNSTVTGYGNATQGSVDPFGANWSNYFPANGNYLTGSNSIFNISATTVVWNFECWVYPISSGVFFAIGSGGTYGNSFYFDWGLGTANKFRFIQGSGGSNPVVITTSGTYTGNTWYHVAVSRTSAGVIKLFVNGTLDGTLTYNAGTLATGTTFVVNGCYDNNGLGNGGGNFYISNLQFLVGIALYTANFTPPTTPLTPITNTALLTCQSPSFQDNSANSFALTVTGTPSVQRFSPFSNVSQTPQSYSTYFNGTSDYLTLAVGTGTNIAANTNYTWECWVYLRAHTSGYPCIFGNYANTGNFAMFAGHNGFGSTNYNLITGGALKTSSATIVYNTWTHLAVVRNGTGTNNCVFYINGVAANGVTFSDNGAVTSVGTNNWIGTAGDSVTQSYIDGYISNMRLVNGTAVYTSNFTPPTAPLTAISGTVLLTCQDATIKDNSVNAFAITTTGSPTPRIINPFGYTTSTLKTYDPSIFGGSMYFDGAGDYLSVPASTGTNFGTGNFTVEMWINPSSLSSYNMLYSVSSGSGYLCLIWGATTSVFGLNAYNGVELLNSSTSTTPINQWTHIAFVRSSGTLYFYINGVASGSGAFGSAFGGSTGTVSIAYNPVYAGSYYTNAGISNLRVVKGTAVYNGNFTPPIAPVTAITGTQLLLNGTNAGIYDSAMQTVFETVGNAQISTVQKKYGTGSMYFDGTGDGLQAVGTPNTAFGNGDFTVEFWINLAANMANYTKVIQMGTTGNCFTVESQGTTNVLNITNYTTTVYLASSTALTPSTWTHVAVTRASGTLRIFQNGTQTGSVANTIDFANSGSVYIGQSSTGQAMNGYLDDFRITKGYARYTANFTPPAAALPTS